MKRTFLLLAALLSLSSFAQALWTSAEVKGDINKRFSVSAEVDYRTSDKLKSTERFDVNISTQYRIFKWLRANAGFTFIDQHVGLSTTKKGNIIPAYWQPKYRWQVGLTGKYSFDRFTISLREQLQVTYRTSQYVSKYSSSGKPKDDEYIAWRTKTKLRSRLGIEYDIKKTPLEPFANIELYNCLNDNMAKDKLRFTIGTDIKLNKRNAFSIYYRYIDEADDDDPSGNIIGVGYTHKFHF